MKICCHCKINKNDNSFYKQKSSKDGLKPDCIECHNRHYNKETNSKRCKEYRALHKEELKKWHKNNYVNNKQAITKKIYQWRDRNLEKVRGYKKKYRNSNKEKLAIKHRLRNQNDIQYNLNRKYRTLLWSNFKKYNKKKNAKSLDFLGCSWDFFTNFFEKQFDDKMTWELFLNGQITIDHYIPCEAFNIENQDELKICFGWKNLRPAWDYENYSKQDIMPDGRRARHTKFEYSLQNKIDLIEKRFLSLNLNLNIEQKLPNIFINKSQWLTFSPDQMTRFEEDIFNYYKSKGFPYFELDKQERNEIFNKLVNFNSSDILKENNILSQNMLGLNLATYYMPHLWETRSGNFMTPMEVFNNDKKFKLAIKKRIKIGDNISDAGIRKILSMYSGAHKVSNFRPTIAKYIYDNYSGAGNVLDFSSGFGGRLLGALSSNKVINYYGFEPSKKTAECLFNIIKDFKLWKSNISTLPFEDSNLLLNDFDLAFSSPPYFNVEKYSDEPTQSYIRYKTKEEWREKFLKVLIEKCYSYLKSGGYFIINIANVKTYSDLEQDTIDLAKNTGFILEKTYKMQLSALMKKDFKYEPIFVFKKV